VFLRDLLVIAVRSLRSHKLRSGLTMLGLIIGVGAVILLSSFGSGVAVSVNAAVEPIANNIIIVPKLSPIPGGPSAKPLTDKDFAAIDKIPGVAFATPTVDGSRVGAAGQAARALAATAGANVYMNTQVNGSTADFLETWQRKMARGRFFTEAEEHSGARVAVLGPLVAQSMYGPDPDAALGKTITINHRIFKVIGIFVPYGATYDSNVVMPLTAARAGVFGRGIGGNELSSIVVRATSTAAVKPVEQQIAQILMRNHHIDNSVYNDFQIQDLGSRLTTFAQLTELITTFVPAIAAISLLVGGIGVLNIMLVSVTDRTREIGTRKAIGASDGAILIQFAAEAIALAGMGGTLGVVGGVGLIGATKVLVPLLGPNGFMSTFDPAVSPPTIAVAFTISLAIGLIAGGYPAWRAAQLKPIEALRFE
jgi:putative ABC transport system permease protein